MSDNVGGGNDLLKTAIGLDFGQAKNDIKDFGKDVDNLSQHFEYLSDVVRDSMREVRLNVSGLIKKQLEELGDSNSKTAIDVSNKLREKIEQAISRVIMNKDIDIVDGDGKKLTYQFRMNEGQLDKLNKKIASAFVDNFNINDFKGVNVTLTRDQIRNVRNKFQEVISKALSDPNNIKYGWSGKETTDKIQLTISKKQVNTLFNSIKEKLENFLSDPANISFKDTKNLRISANSVNKITKQMTEYLSVYTDSVIKALKEASETSYSSLEKLKNISKLSEPLKQLENSIKSLNVDVKIDLQEAVNLAVSKVEEAVMRAVELAGVAVPGVGSSKPTVFKRYGDSLTTPKTTHVEMDTTHLTSNIDSLRNADGSYSFKQYDNAISLARRAEEEMSYPNVNDFKGVMGRLNVLFKGNILDYTQKEHREFLDSLWEEIKKQELYPKLDKESMSRQEIGRLIADTKLKFLNELRQRGVDAINNFTIDVDPDHTKGSEFTKDGFFAKELHVLNSKATEVKQAVEFAYDRKLSKIFEEATKRFSDIVAKFKNSPEMLRLLSEQTTSEYIPIRKFIKDNITPDVLFSEAELKSMSDGDIKYHLREANNYLNNKMSMVAKQIKEMSHNTVGEDARIRRALSESTKYALGMTDLSSEIPSNIQNSTNNVVRNINNVLESLKNIPIGTIETAEVQKTAETINSDIKDFSDDIIKFKDLINRLGTNFNMLLNNLQEAETEKENGLDKSIPKFKSVMKKMGVDYENLAVKLNDLENLGGTDVNVGTLLIKSLDEVLNEYIAVLKIALSSASLDEGNITEIVRSLNTILDAYITNYSESIQRAISTIDGENIGEEVVNSIQNSIRVIISEFSKQVVSTSVKADAGNNLNKLAQELNNGVNKFFVEYINKVSSSLNSDSVVHLLEKEIITALENYKSETKELFSKLLDEFNLVNNTIKQGFIPNVDNMVIQFNAIAEKLGSANVVGLRQAIESFIEQLNRLTSEFSVVPSYVKVDGGATNVDYTGRDPLRRLGLMKKVSNKRRDRLSLLYSAEELFSDDINGSGETLKTLFNGRRGLKDYIKKYNNIPMEELSSSQRDQLAYVKDNLLKIETEIRMQYQLMHQLRKVKEELKSVFGNESYDLMTRSPEYIKTLIQKEAMKFNKMDSKIKDITRGYVDRIPEFFDLPILNMTKEEFLRKRHFVTGYYFHGGDKLDKANPFYGLRHAEGKGFYTTNDYKTAKKYAGSSGVVNYIKDLSKNKFHFQELADANFWKSVFDELAFNLPQLSYKEFLKFVPKYDMNVGGSTYHDNELTRIMQGRRYATNELMYKALSEYIKNKGIAPSYEEGESYVENALSKFGLDTQQHFENRRYVVNTYRNPSSCKIIPAEDVYRQKIIEGIKSGREVPEHVLAQDVEFKNLYKQYEGLRQLVNSNLKRLYTVAPRYQTGLVEGQKFFENLEDAVAHLGGERIGGKKPYIIKYADLGESDFVREELGKGKSRIVPIDSALFKFMPMDYDPFKINPPNPNMELIDTTSNFNYSKWKQRLEKVYERRQSNYEKAYADFAYNNIEKVDDPEIKRLHKAFMRGMVPEEQFLTEFSTYASRSGIFKNDPLYNKLSRMASKNHRTASNISSLEALEHRYGKFVAPKPIDRAPILQESKSVLDKQLNNIEEQIKIGSIGKDLTINLDKVVADAIKKVEDAVKLSLKNWKPVTENTDNLKEISDSTRKIVQSMIDSFGKSMSTEIERLMDSNGNANIKYYIKQMNSLVNKFFQKYIEQVTSTMFSDSSQSGAVFSIRTAELHKVVRQRMAGAMNMTVEQFVKQNPLLQGDDALRLVLQENMRAIFSKYHQSVQKNSKELIDQYRNELQKVAIKPDMSAVHFLTMQMTTLQQEIIRKVKQVIQEQFGVIIKELRGMKVLPASIGAVKTPTVTPTRRTGGAATSVSAPVVPQGVQVNSMPVVTPYTSSIANRRRVDPGGDTRTFAGSVRNTMRYITAGALMGVPMTALHDSWNSFKEFDYEFQKATQNILAKYRGVNASTPFEDLAKMQVEERHKRANELGSLGISDDVYFDPVRKQQLIEQLRKEFEEFATKGIIEPLQDLAVNYALNQQDIGAMYQIGTRRYDNPYAALAQTSAAARIFAVEREEINPLDAAKGLEAIAAQWGINPLERTKSGELMIDKFANMVIKTSLITQATADDILKAQERSGSVFRSFLPEDMDKSKQFAISTALSSIFVQSTAGSGNEAGTFWRRIFSEPFKRETAEMLKAMSESTDPILQRLNPYKEIIDDKLYRTTVQKSGYEMFTNIVDAYTHLKRNNRANEANNLISMYAENRNFGSYHAITTFIEELNKLSEKMSETDLSGLDQFVESIYTVQQSEIDQYIGGMSRSIQFKQDQMRAGWQTALTNIYNELKPELSHVMDSLIGFFRVVKDNAETTATILQGIVKVLMGYGLYRLAKTTVDKAKQTMYSAEYAGRTRPLMDEKQSLVEKRAALYEKFNTWKGQAENLAKQRVSVDMDRYTRLTEKKGQIESEIMSRKDYLKRLKSGKPINEADEAQAQLRGAQISADTIRVAMGEGSPEYLEALMELEQAQKRVDDIKATGVKPIDRKKEISRTEKHLKSLEQAQSSIGSELRSMDGKMNIIAERWAEENMNKLQQEIAETDAAMAKLDMRIYLLKKAFTELGVDEKQLETALNRYTISMRNMTSAENSAQIETTELAKDMERLNRLYQSGAISARQYIQQLTHLQATASRGVSGVNVGGVGGSVGRAGAKAAGAKAAGSAASSAAASGVSGAAGGIMTGAGAGALLGGLAGAGVGVLAVLASTLVTDTFSKMIGSMFLTPGEQKSHYADNLEKLANSADRIATIKGEGDHLSGYLNTLPFMWNMITDGIAQGFGADTPSFGDYWTAMRSGGRQYSWENLKIEEKRADADRELGKEQREREQRAMERWVDITGDGVKDVDPLAIEGSLETIDDFITRMNERVNLIKAETDSVLSVQKTKAIMSGKRADSDDVLKYMTDYYKANIDIIKEAIEDIKYLQDAMLDQRGSYARNEAGYRKLEAERLVKEKELAELQLQQLEVVAQKFQAIDARYSLRSTKEQSQTTYDLAFMYAGGTWKDSPEYIKKALEGVANRIDTYTEHMRDIEAELKGGYVDLDGDGVKETKITQEMKEQREAQIAQMRAEYAQASEEYADLLQAYRTSPVAEIQRDREYDSKGYDIMRAQLEARGYSGDSMAMKMLQKQQLESDNRSIDQMIATLRKAYNETYYKDGWMGEKILQQIRDLEAEQATNLANIFKIMNNTATWGLPAGVTPMTNYQYEAQKNSERSVVLQQGNVYVNVKFDNVYARDKEEFERNVAKPLTETMKNINREMTTGLNRQASSYVSNYR